MLGSNPPRTAITEADGGFAFDALVGRPYTLIARAAQGVAGPVTARLTAKSDPIVLHLHAAAKVTVTVIGLDGKPIDDANVELRGTDQQHETTKHGAAVFASVVPGGYQVAAWADGTAKVFQWLTVGAGENATRIVLVAGAPVTGRVVDERGKGVAGARVVASAASAWNQQGDRRRDGVATGPDGAFRFDALPAGTVRFLASHPDLAPGSSALVTLDGKTERGGITITLSDGATVRGRVVDLQHQPVIGARIRIGAAQRGIAYAPPRQTYSDDKGAFEIRGLPKVALEAIAIHETGSSKAQQIDATRADPGAIELVLDQTGTIAGVVVDPTGTALEGVQVTAVPSFGDARAGADIGQFRMRGLSEELTDSNGHFTLTGLSDGNYNITAMRSRAITRGRRGATEGTPAHTGATDVKIVLQPEGAVKGKVAYTDGTAPAMFTVSLGMTQQSFTGDGTFEIDALAPQPYQLNVRGPFQPKGVDVEVEPGKTADVGTIVVVPGRTLAGIVTSGGSPVPNANVYAGRIVIGNGTSTNSGLGQGGGLGGGTKSTTSGEDGTFSLAGFSDGDLTLIAERDDIGRSKAMRVPTEMPGQGELVLELQSFGSLSGMLSQNGGPAVGTVVTCQSTTTPGALYTVASGPDGRYRFDKLAPDTYKVSATLGTPRRGMQFFSKQVDVPLGANVVVDLSVQQGNVTLEVTAAPRAGTLGMASAWLASGVIAAATESALALQMAAQGAGTSQWVVIRRGAPAAFNDLSPGAYTACVVPLPSQVSGFGALGYMERHGDKLPAFCQQVTVAPSPPQQTAAVAVDIPPYISDGQGSGSATK